jgi:hypothetical protein
MDHTGISRVESWGQRWIVKFVSNLSLANPFWRNRGTMSGTDARSTEHAVANNIDLQLSDIAVLFFFFELVCSFFDSIDLLVYNDLAAKTDRQNKGEECSMQLSRVSDGVGAWAAAPRPAHRRTSHSHATRPCSNQNELRE